MCFGMVGYYNADIQLTIHLLNVCNNMPYDSIKEKVVMSSQHNNRTLITHPFIPNSIHSWHSNQTSHRLHLKNIHFPSQSTSHTKRPLMRKALYTTGAEFSKLRTNCVAVSWFRNWATKFVMGSVLFPRPSYLSIS